MRPGAALSQAVIVLGCAAGALAADRYVSKEGSNANPGSFAQPFLTIQHAINQAAAGDVIHVRGTTALNAQAVYGERLIIGGVSGTAAQPITLRGYSADAHLPAVDGAALTPVGTQGMIHITGRNHWTIMNLEVRNFQTAAAPVIPCGVYISGACAGLRLSGLKVHDIHQNNTASGGNGFGIAAYGDAAVAIDGLTIENCEVYNLRTGSSESVVLNGNVTNFLVTGNVVHDCNNIGIDFIGHEGTNGNSALDRARNGVCRGNLVYNIDSQFNPAYGGNFAGTFPNQDARNNARAAPGIYVDGGADIVIERNTVRHCNIGVSIGSENSGKASDNVILRNNLVRHNHVGGLFLGGAGTGNGGAASVSISHNTFYQNDTELWGGGSVAIQHYVSATTIRHNVFFGFTDGSGWAQFILKTSTDGSFAANAINWNYYSGASAPNNLEFIWNGLVRNAFNPWKTTSSQDANSTYTTASLGFANAAGGDFTLTSAAALKDAGDPAFTAANGEKDFGGQSRVAGGRVDIGMDEFLTAWQAWRDQYFGLPDGGGVADADDDPDQDGAKNLVEYSQGMSPVVSDAALLPAAAANGGSMRFTYRKNAAELVYTVATSADLIAWSPAALPEQTDGAGNYWRDVPFGSQPFFVHLKVTQP